jgi:hypothetical protein
MMPIAADALDVMRVVVVAGLAAVYRMFDDFLL